MKLKCRVSYCLSTYCLVSAIAIIIQAAPQYVSTYCLVSAIAIIIQAAPQYVSTYCHVSAIAIIIQAAPLLSWLSPNVQYTSL